MFRAVVVLLQKGIFFFKSVPHTKFLFINRADKNWAHSKNKVPTLEF